MNKLSKKFLSLGIIIAIWGFISSHFLVYFIVERTEKNLFITKTNALESYLFAIILILLAFYFKKND